MNLRYLLFIAFLGFAIFSINSQNYTLHPNVNPIIHLNQEINNNSLLLSDENKIYKVYLLNRTTKEVVSYQNDSKNISIHLGDLKSSYYSVMVHNGEKRIIVLGVDIENELNSNSSQVITKVEAKKNNIDIEVKRKAKAFWVIKEVKKHGGSTISTYYYHNRKYMETAIRKNRQDIKSFSGRNNRLTIYEVYNLNDFIKIKSKLVKNYYYAKDLVLNEKERDAFNIIPFYKSNIENTLISSITK